MSVFDQYTDKAETSPVLGWLVLYSIFRGEVTPEELEEWFDEFDLDTVHLPPPLRADDAFERVTGPQGVKAVYSLDDPTADRKTRPRRKSGDDAGDRVATLMVRHVRRDSGQLVRHLVREVRDEERTELSYDTRLGVIAFIRSDDPDAAGAGKLRVEPDAAAIADLPQGEQDRVEQLLAEVTDLHTWHSTYMGPDRLRAIVRRYVEALGGLKVRPTGGVYFVTAEHEATLAGLREVVARFGSGSHFVRVPLPDEDEMREMIVNAFTNQAREDLEKLAEDIAAAKANGAGDAAVTNLHNRFQQLSRRAEEYSERLSDSLDDTHASLRLVNMQLAELMMRAAG
ncbi:MULTISPECIES: DUF6744 family protein [Nocardia]|uniref:Uncharacterized protein n=1 Tax=Nocardia farcinica TaxID=37329 RepID=A0A0H5PA58_NOCFR|nr:MULTISPECIES: DUF6744 family protein [Nocardia]AVH20171.1 hypothetical protein C5B73_00565 [Nocardia cyriacigeorgica]AXK89955.1 hypothetical protein DXT66_29635 [Nocardia farcinica]PFW99385.1 hypothetical protein CJ469_05305 [Nocardia farcinica]PFX06796.1 hypothetical protein CJ468_04196 [Nocardia farcinica]CRY84587.1 Uncharacterised protein [Nocardia farcinica]